MLAMFYVEIKINKNYNEHLVYRIKNKWINKKQLKRQRRIKSKKDEL